MLLLSVFLFSIAVSADGFGVGIAYGLRRISIPWYSMSLICFTSTIAITFSMVCGHLIGSLINPALAKKLGAAIMVAVGVWLLLQAYLKPKDNKIEDGALLKINIRSLGIVIQILREPVQADFDRSGKISPKEALALGFALAMDALGAGFGAAVAGLAVWFLPVVVGICKFILISLGFKLGAIWGDNWSPQRLAFLPGLIIVSLGVLSGIGFSL
ncbi:MAG: sporulation membrane protein YtaF [Bacillota bacterium]